MGFVNRMITQIWVIGDQQCTIITYFTGHVYLFYPGTPDGKTKFSEIKAFLAKEQTAVTMYKQMTTSSNQTISLTGNHLIYVRKRFTDQFLPL